MINHRILLGLKEEWKQLIPSLVPALPSVTTDNLATLLLQQDERISSRTAMGSPGLDADLLDQPMPSSIATARGYYSCHGHGFTVGHGIGARGHDTRRGWGEALISNSTIERRMKGRV